MIHTEKGYLLANLRAILTGTLPAKLIAVLVVVLAGLPSTVLGGHDGLGGVGLFAAHSVRSISMGETGLVETGNALGFGLNPAALPFLTHSGVGIGYGGQAQGLSASRTTLSGVMPLGPGIAVPGAKTFGRRFGVGFEFDHSGLELSQGSSWATEKLAAGAGCRVSPYASLGFLFKMLFSNTSLEGAGVSAFGIDLTALLEMRSNFSLALAVRNLGGSAGWEAGEDESLPLAFSLGGHLLLPRRISADLTASISGSDQTQCGFGFDVPILETGFSVRGGYLYQGGDYSRNVPTFGLGFVYEDFQIDYAARFDDELALGTTHHFGLTYMFGPGF